MVFTAPIEDPTSIITASSRTKKQQETARSSAYKPTFLQPIQKIFKTGKLL